MVEHDGDVRDVSILSFWVSAYVTIVLLGPSPRVAVTFADSSTINYERDEIINLKFLKIQQKDLNRKIPQGPTGPRRASGPDSISHSRPWTQKKTDYNRRSFRSYLQDGWTGRFGTLSEMILGEEYCKLPALAMSLIP